MSKADKKWDFICKARDKALGEFEAFSEAQDLKEHAQDMIDTYTNEEIAQMVREGILTIDDVETGLRRRIAG